MKFRMDDIVMVVGRDDVPGLSWRKGYFGKLGVVDYVGFHLLIDFGNDLKWCFDSTELDLLQQADE